MIDQQIEDNMKLVLGEAIFKYASAAHALAAKTDHEIGLLLDEILTDIDALSITCAVLEAAAERLKAAGPHQTKLLYEAKIDEMAAFGGIKGREPFQAKIVGLGAFLDKNDILTKYVKIRHESGDYEWLPEIWIDTPLEQPEERGE